MRRIPFTTWVTLAVVGFSTLFVLWVVNPDGVLFSRSTPTGGDLGAHVWGPAFIRDELLPRFRLTGWTPDWYAGFPAFHFYMVVPMLMVVSTTISDGRMLGTVMKKNIFSPLTPSRRTSSTISSGMALIEAERIVIAKPAWIQTRMMIRKNVFHGSLNKKL